MAPLDIANMLYHNAQFRMALQLLDKAGASVADDEDADAEAGCLRIKCLIELDQLLQADQLSRQLMARYPESAVLHYYRGLVLFLQSQLAARATAARSHYEEARRRGFVHANAGLGLLAHADMNYDAALSLFEAGAGDDPELENARYLKMYQTHVAMKNYTAAEEAIVASRRVLARAPSLVRSLWSDLYWLRLLFVRHQWQALRSHLMMLVPIMDPPSMPRLYRCACEGRRWLELGGSAVVVETGSLSSSPSSPSPSSSAPMRAGATQAAAVTGGWADEAASTITSKPVLFELYEYLKQNGTRGADKEAIVTRLWQESYNPLVHDSRLYKAVARLRKILGDDARHPRLLVQKGRTYYLTQNL